MERERVPLKPRASFRCHWIWRLSFTNDRGEEKTVTDAAGTRCGIGRSRRLHVLDQSDTVNGCNSESGGQGSAGLGIAERRKCPDSFGPDRQNGSERSGPKECISVLRSAAT